MVILLTIGLSRGNSIAILWIERLQNLRWTTIHNLDALKFRDKIIIITNYLLAILKKFLIISITVV